MKEIHLSAYDSKWPDLYQQEKQKIMQALEKNTFCIHHVGSTAVTGLASKPKIDIIAEIYDIKKTLEQLPLAGYEFQSEWNVPGKYGYTKRGKLDVNLHVYPRNHAETVGNLLFRDYLIANPEIKSSYERIKYQLTADPHMKKRNRDSLGFPEYTIKKSVFVESILDQLGYDLPRLLKPVTKKHHEYLSDKCLKGEGVILCLKGVNVCGYAEISDSVDLYLDNTEVDQSVFQRLITRWIENKVE